MALTARMVTFDCIDAVGLATFWSDAAGYEIKWRHEDVFLMLGPPAGDGVGIGLQRVAEARAGKNRVHVDWRADDRAAEVARLTQLGASVVAEHGSPAFAWTVLADPEGNEFCVSDAHG
jgi:predicted enzyme related to lactoylglutathione lyase